MTGLILSHDHKHHNEPLIALTAACERAVGAAFTLLVGFSPLLSKADSVLMSLQFAQPIATAMDTIGSRSHVIMTEAYAGNTTIARSEATKRIPTPQDMAVPRLRATMEAATRKNIAIDRPEALVWVVTLGDTATTCPSTPIMGVFPQKGMVRPRL